MRVGWVRGGFTSPMECTNLGYAFPPSCQLCGVHRASRADAAVVILEQVLGSSKFIRRAQKKHCRIGQCSDPAASREDSKSSVAQRFRTIFPL